MPCVLRPDRPGGLRRGDHANPWLHRHRERQRRPRNFHGGQRWIFKNQNSHRYLYGGLCQRPWHLRRLHWAQFAVHAGPGLCQWVLWYVFLLFGVVVWCLFVWCLYVWCLFVWCLFVWCLCLVSFVWYLLFGVFVRFVGGRSCLGKIVLQHNMYTYM